MENVDLEKILEIIGKDSWMMRILENVQSLELPDWWIGAGFVRSKVWDFLHNRSERTPLPDIDVIYFDVHDMSEEAEKVIEEKLSSNIHAINWQVKNQARMHIMHNDKPYESSSEGLSRWVETATCIGVKINESGVLELTFPLGIDDLVNCIVRPNPTIPFNKKLFLNRILQKKWLEKWPKLKVFYK